MVKKPVEDVVIVDPDGYEIDVDGYTLTIGNMAATGAGEADLGVYFIPTDATNTTELWEFVDTNEGIITLNSATGYVVGLKVGRVEIKATVDGISDTAWVNVE